MLEGMDAAARAANIPPQSLDQPHANVGSSGGAKIKPADTVDAAAATGSPAKKARDAADSQAIGKKARQRDDLTEKVINDAIERANSALAGSDRKFEISVHEKTKDIMIKVVDTKTNETIREIPPKKIVDLVVRLCEIAGILYDVKG